MENPVVVHAHIYDPSRPSLFKTSKNEKAKCSVVQCGNKANCGLYARGECAMIALLDVQRCPYGKRTSETGFTQKARGYSSWIRERRDKYQDHMGKLVSYKRKLSTVGEYVFLPYSHMNMNQKLPVEQHSHLFSSGTYFILASNFTVDVIIDILKFKPQAMMGGEITSYQKEVLPKFAKHLQEIMPDMYNAVLEKYPEISSVISNYSSIGRTAFVRSLKPGTVITKYHDSRDLKTQHWTWDGEYVTSNDAGMSFSVVEYDECETRLKPKPNATMVVTNDNQVDDETEFAD